MSEKFLLFRSAHFHAEAEQQTAPVCTSLVLELTCRTALELLLTTDPSVLGHRTETLGTSSIPATVQPDQSPQKQERWMLSLGQRGCARHQHAPGQAALAFRCIPLCANIAEDRSAFSRPGTGACCLLFLLGADAIRPPPSHQHCFLTPCSVCSCLDAGTRSCWSCQAVNPQSVRSQGESTLRVVSGQRSLKREGGRAPTAPNSGQ